MRGRSAPRRRTGVMVTQLGLAALFLAVIGGSVGFIIGTTRDQTQTPRRPAALPPAPAVEPTFPVPTSAATPSPAVTATTPPGGELCPEHTQQVAREKAGSPGYLRQVLRVHTARSDVWICRDAAGALFYQGLTSDGTSGVAREFREGVNALFLPGVVRLGAGYRATNVVDGKTTRYDVTTAKLVISTGADVRTEPVTEYQ